MIEAVMRQIERFARRGDTDGATRLHNLTRAALTRIARDRRHRRNPSAVAASLRTVCNAAHEQGLHAEQLVILVKQDWHHLSETQRLNRLEADAMLAGIVSTCIKEFFHAELQSR